MLPCPDFPFQGSRFAIRLHIELLSERLLASLVLVDGRCSITGETEIRNTKPASVRPES